MSDVGSYTVAGRPGAGADRVIDYQAPAYLTKKPTDAREAKRLADDEKARMKFVSDAGKAVKFSQGSEILDEDQETIRAATDEYIDMAADMADPANKDKYKSTDSQRELAKKRQEIAMLTAKAQQHYKTVKFGDQKVALHRNLWDFEKYKEARDKYTSTPLKERGDDPGFRMREQTDFLTPFSKKGKMPAVATWTKDIPGPDGTTSVQSYSGMDPEKAKELASTLLSNQDDPQVKGLMEYALVNGLEQVNPNWAQNMTPKEQGLIVRKTAEQMLVDYWGTLIPTKEGDKIKKTPGDQNAQYGLADAEKAGIVIKDAREQVAYQEAGKTKIHDMPIFRSMDVPQNSKTKTVIPASSEMIDVSTGKPVTDPGSYLFVPGKIKVQARNSKAEAVVKGYIIDKASIAAIKFEPGSDEYDKALAVLGQKNIASGVEVPLGYMINNLKKAGVQVKWVDEAMKELEEILKKQKTERLKTQSKPAEKNKKMSPGESRKKTYNKVTKKFE